MKINIRLLYGILSIILALIIAFIAIPAVTRKTASTTEIIRIAETVYAGECITETDLETVTVGNFNLPQSLATKPEDVIGTYAVTNLYPGDYVLPQKVSSTPLSSDPSLDAIPDGMMAFSVSVRSLAVGLSDKLQVGDIVRVYHYDDNQVLDPVPDIPGQSRTSPAGRGRIFYHPSAFGEEPATCRIPSCYQRSCHLS